MLAYKYVALAVMFAEINYCATRLSLKENLPVNENKVIMAKVYDPEARGVSGRIDTPQYSFCLLEGGRLRFITKLEDMRYQSDGLYRGNEPLPKFMERLSKIPSIINTNDAFRIATNWLAAMDVDLARLEKEQPVTIEQQFVFIAYQGQVPVPIFYVTWGKDGMDRYDHHLLPVVDIMISGIDGGLLNLRQEDDSYSKRPVSLIKDMDKLLAITDKEFLGYSQLERSNLVVRFAAVQYPELDRRLEVQTNAVALPFKAK